MHRRRFVPAFALVACLLVARNAGAQEAESHDDALARSFFESARAYFDAARYDDAAEAFAEAYRLSGRPQLLVNQARALESAQRRDEAIAVLEEALARLASTEVVLRGEVEARLRRLVAERDRDRGREAEAARQAEERAAAERAAAEAVATTPVEPAAEAPRSRPGGRFVVGLSAAGLAGASLGVALGTGLRVSAIDRDLSASCPGGLCPTDRRDDVTRGERLARTNTAMLFVAGGAAAVAIPMLILGIGDRNADDGDGASRASDEGAPAVRVEVAGGPGDVGLGLLGRF